ncbi:MAG: DUF5034 domain-containing protein [Bacteroidetes bacterium]|nr:DUF5034 domain-containing protein [Bacteroidota bacterium]
MQKKLLLFVILLALIGGLLVINSCYKKDPPSNPSGTQTYCWKSISSTILNNCGEFPHTTTANTVNKNCYGFTIEFESSFDCGKKYGSPEFYTPNFSLKDSFKIITLYDFDMLHKKGTDVSEYFSATLFDAATFEIPVIISDWRKSLTKKTRKKLLTTYFFLMQPPTLSDSVQFEISLSQRNAVTQLLSLKTRRILLAK